MEVGSVVAHDNRAFLMSYQKDLADAAKSKKDMLADAGFFDCGKASDANRVPAKSIDFVGRGGAT